LFLVNFDAASAATQNPFYELDWPTPYQDIRQNYREYQWRNYNTLVVIQILMPQILL
jgi:hypothetical protein